MSENLSNQVKVLFVDEDIASKGAVERRSCRTVQQFGYLTTRALDRLGWPYGPSSSVTMRLRVRAELDGIERFFYRLYKTNEQFTFTLLFNALFDKYKTLCEYDGATVVTGYVVQIDDTFKSYRIEQTEEDQMVMDVYILVSTIKYVVKNQERTLFILRK